MAWTAHTSWERWNPEQYMICPFDASHRITAARFQRHLVKCRKNFPGKDFVSCPFNATHQVLRPHLRNHICQCPDKNVVEPSYNECYKDFESLGKCRGDTSVPKCQTPGLYDEGDEDWDKEIAAQNEEIFPRNVPQITHRPATQPTRFEQESLMGLKRQALRREMKQKALQEQENQRWT